MEKIKQTLFGIFQSEKGKDIMIVMIVVLVGLGSFELGRLSKEATSGGIKIEYPQKGLLPLENQEANTVLFQNSLESNTNTFSTSKTSLVNSKGKNFFASNRGSKYYSIGCSAGKSLKLENRVYFTTKEEAEKAGYTLSASCN
jgi:hypothetical protein